MDKKNIEEKSLINKQKKQDKIKEKNAKKLSKNVIMVKKTAQKDIKAREKNNKRRTKKTNKRILTKNLKDKEIFLKINEFNTNGKKTIVYFIDSFFPIIDGALSVMDNYARLMVKDYNIVVCCPKHQKKTYYQDDYFVLACDSIYIKKQGYDLGFPGFDSKFVNYISHLNIDLVHIHAPFSLGTFGLELAKKRNIPSITTFHSQFKQNFYNAVKNEGFATVLTKIVMNVYQKSTITITMNEFSKGIMKEYGLKNKQVEIIPNATNLIKKDFDLNFENETLKKYGINKDKFNIIFIGRFVEVKNVYFILDVLIELYKINKNFNFIFLGYGPEEKEMKKICKENGLENIIKITGKIDNEDEKAIIIKNSNLLFFPSVYDTDGIVRLECACYNVPTLCIENTGVASGLKNNHNGFIEKNDKNAFTKRLDKLINNPDLVKKIGNNARKEIYITWPEVGKKLKETYEKILNKKYFKKIRKNKNID